MNINDWLPVFTQHDIIIKRFIILACYALLAKAVDVFINRVLGRLVKLSRMELDDEILGIIHSPVYWTVFCLGILHAVSIAPLPPPWEIVLPGAAKSVIVVIWSVTALKIIRLTLRQKTLETLLRRQIPATAFNIITKILRIFLVIFAVAWLLGVWQVDLTPFFASAGIAGIAVAMAAKDSLSNFFGGLSIFMDNIFKEGDYIVLDSGERGEVMEVGMRSTRIKTRDDILITIPNSILANTKVINESAPIPRFRIKIPVGVAYGSSPEIVGELLLGVAAKSSLVSRAPNVESRVRFRSMGPSSLDFELLCWVDNPRDKGRAAHELLTAIYKALVEAGISIPFPQLDVHLIN